MAFCRRFREGRISKSQYLSVRPLIGHSQMSPCSPILVALLWASPNQNSFISKFMYDSTFRIALACNLLYTFWQTQPSRSPFSSTVPCISNDQAYLRPPYFASSEPPPPYVYPHPPMRRWFEWHPLSVVVVASTTRFPLSVCYNPPHFFFCDVRLDLQHTCPTLMR